jgi:hypothetical protein
VKVAYEKPMHENIRGQKILLPCPFEEEDLKSANMRILIVSESYENGLLSKQLTDVGRGEGGDSETI